MYRGRVPERNLSKSREVRYEKAKKTVDNCISARIYISVFERDAQNFKGCRGIIIIIIDKSITSFCVRKEKKNKGHVGNLKRGP